MGSDTLRPASIGSASDDGGATHPPERIADAQTAFLEKGRAGKILPSVDP